MKIDKKVLDNLTAQAAENPRMRMNLDMRNSAEDNSQRMLNAMEPGTELPIHRHMHSSETIIVLRGAVRHHIYDENGQEIETVTLKPNSDCMGFDTPAGVWHRSESLEPGTVIFEAKDGKYQPLSENEIMHSTN